MVCLFFSLNHSLLISVKVTTATAPNRKFISKNDQEQLLQDSYNNLGDDEDTLNEEATTYFA